MDESYIKLWRKSLDSGLIQNPNLWTFWTWCLLKASWKKRKMTINLQVIDLEPGQFIFGRKSASQQLGMSEQVIRTCLKKLKTLQNLTIKTTNKYSIITIVNWDSYQQQQPAANQQINPQVTSKQPAANHKQEGNKEKKSKNKENIPPLLSEITEYCLERKNGIDAQNFIDHYEANGWMRGKNKIKSWKACVRTWEGNNKKTVTKPLYATFED